MRLPRDISGDDLVRALPKFGYVDTRQTGSHLRLTTQVIGEHHVTVPRHRTLRLNDQNLIAAAMNVGELCVALRCSEYSFRVRRAGFRA